MTSHLRISAVNILRMTALLNMILFAEEDDQVLYTALMSKLLHINARIGIEIKDLGLKWYQNRSDARTHYKLALGRQVLR